MLKITGEVSRLINIDFEEYLNKLCNSTDLNSIISIYNKLKLLKNLLIFNLNKSITWNYTSSLLRKELSI